MKRGRSYVWICDWKKNVNEMVFSCVKVDKADVWRWENNIYVLRAFVKVKKRDTILCYWKMRMKMWLKLCKEVDVFLWKVDKAGVWTWENIICALCVFPRSRNVIHSCDINGLEWKKM